MSKIKILLTQLEEIERKPKKQLYTYMKSKDPYQLKLIVNLKKDKRCHSN